MQTVTLDPIEKIVPGVIPGTPPTQEQWDAYNEHTHDVAVKALAETPDGIELRYPSGAFDMLRLTENGDIEAVPTDRAPTAEPDPEPEEHADDILA